VPVPPVSSIRPTEHHLRSRWCRPRVSTRRRPMAEGPPRSPIRRTALHDAIAASRGTSEAQLHRAGRTDHNSGNNENRAQLNERLWLVSRSRS
jgi:hypothetical protein